MKKIGLILVLVLFVVFTADAQRWKKNRLEYTIGVGASNYIGDIGGAMSSSNFNPGDLDLMTTRPNFSAGLRYRLAERFALRGNLTYANFKNSDLNSQNEWREFSFTTNMFELCGHLEWHITPEKEITRYSTMGLRDGGLKNYNFGINTYFFVGLGFSYFKPNGSAKMEVNQYYTNSKNLAIVFPIGLGLKYPLSSISFIGLELGGRFTTSDYIDGYSSIYSTSNDVYYFTQITFVQKIIKGNKRRKMRF